MDKLSEFFIIIYYSVEFSLCCSLLFNQKLYVMSLITSISKDLSKVKSDISNDYLDRTEGVKKGNLTSIMPSYKFSFADGTV